MNRQARVTLSPYNTGFSEESEWDAWVAFVCDRIDDAVGFEVDVCAEQWSSRVIVFDDLITGDAEARTIVREAIQILWEAWCAEGAPGAA